MLIQRQKKYVLGSLFSKAKQQQGGQLHSSTGGLRPRTTFLTAGSVDACTLSRKSLDLTQKLKQGDDVLVFGALQWELKKQGAARKYEIRMESKPRSERDSAAQPWRQGLQAKITQRKLVRTGGKTETANPQRSGETSASAQLNRPEEMKPAGNKNKIRPGVSGGVICRRWELNANRNHGRTEVPSGY
jgi:hypothetical protein